MESITRRNALRIGGLAAAGLALGSPRALLAAGRVERKRSIRIAHLTDIHVEPELRAAEGFAACLRHVQSHADKPQLILSGGDMVMDSFDQGEERTKLLWELFAKVYKEECSIPMDGCLGNHDCWGGNKAKSKTTGDEPLWGKKRAMSLLGMSKPYRSFSRAGWRFILLDSVFVENNSYTGKLDDEQWEWLDSELKADAKTPTLLLSHIPILTATQLVGAKKGAAKRELSDSLMMTDSSRFVAAFAKCPNVKLALSGHVHEVDRIDYQGVSYLCNGAVSGNWWKGRHKQCDEGYAILDLFDDGTFENRYVPFGWKAEKA